MNTKITVAGYLLSRLKQIGVDHLFGVPGDFVLGFLNEVMTSDLKYVGTCNELNAAYAPMAMPVSGASERSPLLMASVN